MALLKRPSLPSNVMRCEMLLDPALTPKIVTYRQCFPVFHVINSQHDLKKSKRGNEVNRINGVDDSSCT